MNSPKKIENLALSDSTTAQVRERETNLPESDVNHPKYSPALLARKRETNLPVVVGQLKYESQRGQA